MAERLPNAQRWTTLYQLRRTRGWTRIQLAENIGCSHGLVCDIEAGRLRVSEMFIDRACHVFGITDTWDLERTVPPAQRSMRTGRLRAKAAS